MKVDKETLQKVAHLARLNIKPEEEDQLLKDMGEILNWVEKLREVNTEGVEPLTHMTGEVNVLRADKAEATIDRQQALKNAPQQDGKFFIVPQVMKRND
ncbi:MULTISPECIES: Asp-tRNA(Asn)/Glu-tRNA(Gln) amidotransferase subunit GatC [unclassified Roseivirga]|jgi:aspartyl-tRNA(Asn)/glutamyl-tRNA(Gln) amidotransferase subunit C|uniref:Asp-tRNA(Asn)/Glu-tRNA(Gln) amidotransferase subunit GatC n=1 Tax=unclassified Roseivirga TaxID=2626142 RepID=UPI00257C4A9A|nr:MULTISPECIES: Asp-tRNA(Asn)/Glu-tRNA(Gln) amidotransferase subunit GatC [unclassified Roseivirga]|tara:strand:+ start:7400 stop:7696 length:297 start_codon:yes stop_codon:yes gene_type:complete